MIEQAKKDTYSHALIPYTADSHLDTLTKPKSVFQYMNKYSNQVSQEDTTFENKLYREALFIKKQTKNFNNLTEMSIVAFR